MEWKPVENGLPSDNRDVLCSVDFDEYPSEVLIGFKRDLCGGRSLMYLHEEQGDHMARISKISAWMECPPTFINKT